MALPNNTRANIDRFARALHPQKVMQEAVGDLAGVEVMYNQVLVAIYVRPEMTKGGIIRPHDNVAEDVFQGKVGLVLKLGPNAFVNDASNDFFGQSVAPGDWVLFYVHDARSLIINNVPCRLVQDSFIRMRLADPTLVTQ